MESSEPAMDQSKIASVLAIKQVGERQYEGLQPLFKPSEKSRGVYGGALCAQAIVVAMQTVPADFVPHSLHSYFVKAGDDTKICRYEVEKLNDGNNFANRLVRLFQDDQLKYIIMISLTKKNSIKKTAHNYNQTGKGPRPFEFQKSPNAHFYKYKPEDVDLSLVALQDLVDYKLPPPLADRSLHEAEELSKAAGDREYAFYLKLTDKTTTNTAVKYGSLGIITDTLYLSTVPRILHFPNEIYTKSFFSLSLDHSIYFHDDHFDPCEWLYCQFQCPRFSNNRALFEAAYFSQDGKLVATIIQEGMVIFKNDSELTAKL